MQVYADRHGRAGNRTRTCVRDDPLEPGAQRRTPGLAGVDRALAELCRLYWYPLYAHVRRFGHDPHTAQDLTQEFFARLLEKNYLSTADRKRGKFRWFLLTAFKCFLANEWDRVRAQKRAVGMSPSGSTR